MLSRRRSSERGQSLIFVIAIVGVFSLLIAASLRLASASSIRQSQAMVTSGGNAVSEAAGLLAMDNEGRFDAPSCAVGTTPAGSATFSGGGVNDTISYTLPTCNEPTTFGQGTANRCSLCLLSPSGAALTTNKSITVAGEIALAGPTSLSHNALVCSTFTTPPPTSCNAANANGVIIYSGTAPAPLASFLPTPKQVGAITDPLAGVYPPPSSANPQPDPNYKTQTAVVNSGLCLPLGADNCVYNNFTVKNSDITLQSGTYVILGTMTVGDNSSVAVAPGGTVLLYFGSAGSLTFGTHATLTLSPPTTGPYAGVALFFNATNQSTVDTSGSGDTLSANGLIYAPRTSFNFGDDSQELGSTRLIAWAVTLTGNPGNVGLSVDGGQQATACATYQLSGSGAPGTSDPDVAPRVGVVTTPYGQAHSLFQDCRGGVSTAGTSIAFNYIP